MRTLARERAVKTGRGSIRIWIALAALIFGGFGVCAYADSLKMQAPCAKAFDAGGKATKFEATVGFDDAVTASPGPWGEKRRNRAKMAFRVYADGRLVAETGMLTPKDAPVAIHADIAGAKTVVLEAVDGGYWLGTPYLKAEWRDVRWTFPGGGEIKAADEKELMPQLGILTPPPDAAPRFNGPAIIGARPGNPVLFRIPVTGEKPMSLAVAGLPDGMEYDAARHVLSGSVAKAGEYKLLFTASNAHGKAEREFTLAVGEKLAITPVMGWTSWNAYRTKIDDATIRETARLMVETGLADAGYSYVNLDDGWQQPPAPGVWADAAPPPEDDDCDCGEPYAGPRDASGRIIPAKGFPDMRALAGYVHSLGLKIGLYSSPGPMTCQKLEGSYRHEAIDARTWADWGFDFIKYDYCTYTRIFLAETKERGRAPVEYDHARPFLMLYETLRSLPRDIVFSANSGGHGGHRWGELAGINMWRTWTDLKDSWGGLVNAANTAFELAPYSKSGFWGDPDMLVVGFMDTGAGEPHETLLTHNEQYTHMTLWSLFNAPLLIGCQLDKLDEFTLRLLANPEVIDVNQDIAHPGAKRTAETPSEWIAVKELSDGAYAVGIVNLLPFKNSVTLDFAANGLPANAKLRDIWRREDIGAFAGAATFEIPPHAPVFLRIEKAQRKPAVRFPFVISYGGATNASSVAHFLDAPAGKHGFVRAEGGEFATDAGPIRFNGTNLTGPANFPEHDVADRLADRLARFGINCVRLHYMDTWYKNFMEERRQCLIDDDTATQRKLSAAQFDKLDYLVAALKKRGIYVNMNLHVGRKIDERDGGLKGGLTKTFGHFMPRLVELHREYARDLLTHVNPYTGNAYTDEPAVAMIEITNEDKGIVFAWRDGKMKKWPQEARDELRRQWNAWRVRNGKSGGAPLPDEESDVSDATRRDFENFLWETERCFWEGMRDYIKNTLGAKQPVSGTQTTKKYSPREIQSRLDYVDTHAYFHHPHGPGNRGWIDRADGRDWTAGGESLVHSFDALLTLEHESHWQGKPFTASEYGHPYPSPFSGEGHVLACAFGAAHGWDGVFQYSYNHYPEAFEPDAMPWCVFDCLANPAVLAHFPACAAMLVRGDIRADAIGASKETVWNRERPGKEYYAVDAPDVKAFAGYADGREIRLGDVALNVTDSPKGYAVVSLVSRDAAGFGREGKSSILVAATAGADNDGAKIERTADGETRLVERGHAPVMADGIGFTLALRAAPEKVRCWALAPDGSRTAEITPRAAEGGALLAFGPEFRTVWYEIAIDD